VNKKRTYLSVIRNAFLVPHSSKRYEDTLQTFAIRH
jgi:hypothetical protein